MNVDVCDVGLCYKGSSVLTGINLLLRPGITGVLGVNGAGKTTLFNAITGLKKIDTGSITIDGSPAGSRAIDATRLAYMTQGMTFPGFLTLRQVVSYVLWMRGHRWREATAHAMTALDAVDLADRATRPVKALSGGMQRRLALAASIGGTPDLLLLDEPSTGLDPEQRHIMVELVRNLGGTVLLSSHILEDVLALADRIIVLHDQHVAFDGSTTDFLAHAPTPNAPDAMWQAFSTITGRATAAHNRTTS